MVSDRATNKSIQLFWLSKGHSSINSATEYEADMLNTFCANIQNFTAMNLWNHWQFFHHELQFLKDSSLLNATPKELNKNFAMYCASLPL